MKSALSSGSGPSFERFCARCLVVLLAVTGVALFFAALTSVSVLGYPRLLGAAVAISSFGFFIAAAEIHNRCAERSPVEEDIHE